MLLIDNPKLGVWIPDGDGTCTGLLKFALNETNFENAIVAFVVSMGSPWSIMDSLKKWSNILSDHIKKLNISDEKRDEYVKQQRRLFQLYQEPDESQALLTSKKPVVAASSSSTGNKLQTVEENKSDDEILMPLDPNVLTKNLGIPIIVIVTKVNGIFSTSSLKFHENLVFFFKNINHSNRVIQFRYWTKKTSIALSISISFSITLESSVLNVNLYYLLQISSFLVSKFSFCLF